MNRSSLLLVLAGACGLVFFVATDPKWGPLAYSPARVDEHTPTVERARASVVPESIDAARDASAGTVVGLIGSGVVTAVGVWLVTRRAA